MSGERPVLVRVTGTDDAGAQIMLSTRGFLCDLPDGWLIRYEEVPPEEMSSVHTLVECRPNGVTVLRTGSVVSTIVYRENETFIGGYETPIGLFTLRVYATEVSMKRRGGMGHIRLVYQISLSSALSPLGEMAMRWLDIRFSPCK